MKIKPLTSLRIFFALMVFLRHTSFIFNHQQFRDTHNPFFSQLCSRFFDEGFVGVSFFFMLSGFILCLTYRDKLATGQTGFKDFWVARIARVYPLHLLTLLIAIPVSLSGMATAKSLWLGKLLLNTLLLQSFVPDNDVYFSFNGSSWSISNEMFFYLLFPFIIIAWLKGSRFLKISLCLLPLLIPIGIWLVPATLQHHLFYVNPLFRVVDFLMGILLYNLYERIKEAKLFSSSSIATVAEAGAIGLFALFFTFHNSIPEVYRYSCYYWLPVMLIILVFMYQAGYVSKLLSAKWLVLGGEISFSFYLLHQLVMKYIAFFNAKFFIIHSEYVLVGIIFIVSVAASYWCYRFIEVPANRYIKAKYKSFNLFSSRG